MPIYIGKNKYTLYKNINDESKKYINDSLYKNNFDYYTKNDISILNNKIVINKKMIYNSKFICEIEIVPISNGIEYKMLIKYNLEKTIKKTKKRNYMAIDLGMINVVSLITTLRNKPLIFDGKWLLYINKRFNKKIDKLKSIISKMNKNISKKIYRLLIKRENIITNHLHHLSRHIINYAKKNKINKIIIGYNKKK